MESDHLAEKLRKTTNELSVTRKDAEGMLSVMAGMEKQLSEFQSREEGVSQLSRECKTKVEDALLARDQANAVGTSLKKEVAKLLEERKKTIEEAARGHEDIIDAVKAKMQASIDSRDRQLHELTVNNARLKTTTERCKREKQVSTCESSWTMRFALAGTSVRYVNSANSHSISNAGNKTSHATRYPRRRRRKRHTSS